MKKIIIASALLLCVTVVQAQSSDIARNNNLWFLQLSRVGLNAKWGLENEVHVRIANMGDDMQQVLLRPSVYFKANEAVIFQVGYSFIETYPYGDQPLKIRTPEHNVWVQTIFNHGSVFNIAVSHRYRLEERWVGNVNISEGEPTVDGTLHKNRFRYRMTLRKTIPNTKLYAAAFNEVWLNFGENTGLNRLDQNWLYSGIGYKVSNCFAIETGYMKQVILKSDGIKRESNNTIQLTIHYSINRY